MFKTNKEKEAYGVGSLNRCNIRLTDTKGEILRMGDLYIASKTQKLYVALSLDHVVNERQDSIDSRAKTLKREDSLSTHGSLH